MSARIWPTDPDAEERPVNGDHTARFLGDYYRGLQGQLWERIREHEQQRGLDVYSGWLIETWTDPHDGHLEPVPLINLRDYPSRKDT